MKSRNVNLVHIPAKELLQKCKNKEDIINLCRELGNYDIYIIIIIRYFFSREKVSIVSIFCNGSRAEESKYIF